MSGFHYPTKCLQTGYANTIKSLPISAYYSVIWQHFTLERYTLLALCKTIVSSKPEVLLTVSDCFFIYISQFSAEVVFCFGLFFFIPLENLPEVVEHSQHFPFVSCPFCKA